MSPFLAPVQPRCRPSLSLFPRPQLLRASRRCRPATQRAFPRPSQPLAPPTSSFLRSARTCLSRARGVIGGASRKAPCLSARHEPPPPPLCSLVTNFSAAQLTLIAAVAAVAKGPVVALVFSGGAMDVSPLLANPKVGEGQRRARARYCVLPPAALLCYPFCADRRGSHLRATLH